MEDEMRSFRRIINGLLVFILSSDLFKTAPWFSAFNVGGCECGKRADEKREERKGRLWVGFMEN